MNSSNPKVTVIVPSFNQGQYLAETLDSIIEQDYRPLEVWVVDGASTDETVDVLQTYEQKYPDILRWLSEPDDGPADAVNKGLSRASGEICGIQSSDDMYLPGAISEAVQQFSAHPDCAVIYGEGYPIDEHGEKVHEPWPWKPYSYANYLCASTFCLQSSTFFRREAGLEVGGWRHDYFVADTDFWLRIFHRHKGYKVDRVWSVYRRHPEQRNTQVQTIFDSYWRMMGESVELKNKPLRYRLAADAGRRMMMQFYNPSGSRFVRAYHLWRAILTYPPSWHSLRRHTMLIPGLTRPVEWIKRALKA